MGVLNSGGFIKGYQKIIYLRRKGLILEKLFETLDAWRHLPNYQLERRIDIFFALFLKDIIEQKTGKELLDVIIPEFPLKSENTNRSSKVDYLLFEKNLSKVYFVELKTDDSSRRKKQDKYLQTARETGFLKLLQELKEIFIASKSKKKYFYLFQLLEKAKVVLLPQDLGEYKSKKKKFKIEKIEIIDQKPEIEIFYIQPTNDRKDKAIIDFDFVIKVLSEIDNEFSKKFSTYLEKWTVNPDKDIEFFIEIFHN